MPVAVHRPDVGPRGVRRGRREAQGLIGHLSADQFRLAPAFRVVKEQLSAPFGFDQAATVPPGQRVAVPNQELAEAPRRRLQDRRGPGAVFGRDERNRLSGWGPLRGGVAVGALRVGTGGHERQVHRAGRVGQVQPAVGAEERHRRRQDDRPRRARDNAGKSKAIRIERRAMTTSSSTAVKARPQAARAEPWRAGTGRHGDDGQTVRGLCRAGGTVVGKWTPESLPRRPARHHKNPLSVPSPD